MESIRDFILRPQHFPHWAEDFWKIASPPETLYVRGKKSALELLLKLPKNGLAIVGTRKPQEKTLKLLRNEILQLSASSLTIVSGLARGVDATAHQSALEAGLPTLGVIASGLDIHYPKDTLALRDQILESGGLIISEYPKGTPAYQKHFLMRNRLIAGWSQATWVIEAAQRSGSLNTARWARENQRTCLALPCFPDDPSLQGNRILLDRDHALPYWGVHSLGAVWLEFASFGGHDLKKNQKARFKRE